MKGSYVFYLVIGSLALFICHVRLAQTEMVKDGLVSYWSFDRPPIKVEIQGLVEKCRTHRR